MRLLRPFSPFLLAPFCFTFLAACGPADDSDAGPPKDDFSRRIEAFTGGHTKAVWARYTGGGSDVFGNYDKLQLWGLDTRDGLGIRPVLSDETNYARPLVLPDGGSIVYSNKGTTRGKGGEKRFDPKIWRVDWDGENHTELGPGYAVEVWRDPETGIDWVYASDLLPTERSSIEGGKLERFPLTDPSKREKVWDKTRVSTENIQLSRDGARASCLFPWPDAGVLNLETMTHRKYQHGCWPSMAPDSSHHAWVFDGAHKNLFLFTDGAAEQWVVPVNTAPGVDKHEVYHPRWTNHVRYFALTGPYSGETVTRSDAGEVEVYLGKFSPDLKTVEGWLQLTDDESGDLFPDVWIAGGELASVESGPSNGVAGDAPAGQWPPASGPIQFVWEHRGADNLAEGGRECSVEAKKNARFGPHFEMLTDGGYFVADHASAEAIGKLAGQPFSVEMVARPDATQGTGMVFESAAIQILQHGSRWVYQAGESGGPLGAAEAGRADHLAVSFDGKKFSAYLNGKPSSPAADESGPLVDGGARASVRFGVDWAGSLQGVAISASAASPEQIAASHAHWEKILAFRPAIPTVRLRGKLVEMTAERPVEALDTYQRGLLGYLYEVEEVVEGEYSGKTVVVIHWTILDRAPLPGFPREIGKSYDLTLQPYAAHPELVSERQWNDLLDPSEPWFDVTTP